MSVTATDFQNLIITTLGNADPAIVTNLQTNVPRYWALWARQGVLPELQYWYTRREAIRWCQGYVRAQIDYLRRTQSASRDITATSRQDASMSASGSETASSNADRSSSSTYSDLTNSSGSGSSAGNRSGSQTMSGSGSLSDTGSGSNAASQSSTMSSSSTVNASQCDSTVSSLYQRHEVSGAHRRENQSSKIATGFNLDLNLVVVSGSGGRADTNTNVSEIESGTIQDTMARIGNSSMLARLNDIRANSATQSASQSSSSHFNANRTSSDSMTQSGSSLTTASSSATYSMTGSGTGTMTGTGLGGSTMTATSTRTATSTGEAHRLAQAQSAMTSSMEKLHQRFLHLQDLWRRANEMIAWYEKQRLNLAPYVFAAMTMQYPDGINADAANSYLIKTPLPATSIKPL